MKNKRITSISLADLLEIVEHYCSIIDILRKIRFLSDDELDFLCLVELYHLSLINEFEFRKACVDFFEKLDLL